MTKDGDIERDIESYFGISIMQVRGLNPPNPKEMFTRDWAGEDGIDYYMGETRKVKSSEVTMLFYAVDFYNTAINKYQAFCDWLIAETVPITYRDTLQGRQCNLIYSANKPSWYQLFENEPKKLVAEITFINPTGAITEAV